jgi:ATP-dependent DNA ligase
MGLEGIVSKLRDAPYRSGRSESWIKALCRKRDTFPVVGFIAEQPKSIAALYLGRREGAELLYAGKAGTGFTFETARKLRERLDPLVVRRSPLTKPVKKPKATWVQPDLLIDVEYRAVTPDGRLLTRRRARRQRRHLLHVVMREEGLAARLRLPPHRSRRLRLHLGRALHSYCGMAAIIGDSLPFPAVTAIISLWAGVTIAW